LLFDLCIQIKPPPELWRHIDFSRWRPWRRKYYSGFVFIMHSLDLSQFNADLLLLPVSENKRPPYWNFTSGLQSDNIQHFGLLPFLTPPSFVDMWRFMPKLLAFIENPSWRRPPSWICNTVLLDHPRSRDGGPKKHLRRVLLVANRHDKFEVNFSRSQDMEGVPKWKVGHVHFVATFDLSLHFFSR